ncbi:MAG: M55 family metallopeptidase [Gammaproteobacteria bacterium]|nr:M55 family metallopeptidase [Gammaproteobacteria bacterium]
MRSLPTTIVLLALLLAGNANAQGRDGLKVFISVDMEGITGVVNEDDASRGGKDYDYFRQTMTREANAAIEGALAAGATEIVVRDSHGTALNLLPEMLNRNSKLLRDWSQGPMYMMEGIDASYDAAIFVGYHARAGTPDGVLDHTSSGDVTDVRINGISMPETGYNALMAGSVDVPVVFVAGDKAVCDQAREILGKVETVAVKEGIGAAALNLHPEVSREQIRAGVERALRNLDDYKPYKLEPPYTLQLKLKTEQNIYRAVALYPGARRSGDWEVTYESDDVMEIIRAYVGMRR